MMKLAINRANCHIEKSSRQTETHLCTSTMSIGECSIDEEALEEYMELFTYIQTQCDQQESIAWETNISKMLNSLRHTYAGVFSAVDRMVHYLEAMAAQLTRAVVNFEVYVSVLNDQLSRVKSCFQDAISLVAYAVGSLQLVKTVLVAPVVLLLIFYLFPQSRLSLSSVLGAEVGTEIVLIRYSTESLVSVS